MARLSKRMKKKLKTKVSTSTLENPQYETAISKVPPPSYSVAKVHIKPVPEVLDEATKKKIDAIYKEVRMRVKTSVKETEKDQPTYKVKPQSSAERPLRRMKRRMAKGQHLVEGPMTTLKELAFDYGITPKDLRRILRRNPKITKPGGRWEWGSTSYEVKLIKKLILQSGKASKSPEGQD